MFDYSLRYKLNDIIIFLARVNKNNKIISTVMISSIIIIDHISAINIDAPIMSFQLKRYETQRSAYKCSPMVSI